ncbi:putative sodium-dependent transporter [Actinobacillus equuli]|nr:putative sodium-dependent transporter [Actinobacillus equuli]
MGINYIGSLLSGTLDLSSPITVETTAAYYKESIQNSPLAIIGYTAIFVLVNYFI